MSMYGFEEAKMAAQGDGTALNTSTTPTSILPVQSKYTIPAHVFYIGKVFKITAAGRLSNIVTTPGTLTLDIRFGSTVVFNGGAMQLSTTAHTNVPWMWEALLTCRAVGAAANLMGQGRMNSQAVSISGADPTTGHSLLMTPNTAPAVGNNFDSTTSQVVDLFAAFSISNAGNSIQLHQFVLEELN